MNITVTDLFGTTILVIPVVPDGTKFVYGADYEDFDTINGKIRIPKEEQLKQVEWESFFPVNKKYTFVAPGSLEDGWEYVSFFDNNLKKPIRLVATDDNKKTIENLVMSVDRFSKLVNSVNGNIGYDIKFTEFPMDIWDILGIK